VTSARRSRVPVRGFIPIWYSHSGSAAHVGARSFRDSVICQHPQSRDRSSGRCDTELAWTV